MAKMVRPSDLIPTESLSDGETIPLLTETEFDALTESVRELTVLQPVLISWPDKHIIDGHHRVRAAIKVGLEEIPVVLDETHTPDQQEEIGIQLNAGRRHWTQAAREVAIRKRLKKVPHRADRDVARVLCVDHKTVAKYRHEMVTSGEIPHFDFRSDKNGARRPSGTRTVRTNVPSGRGIPAPQASGAEQAGADVPKPTEGIVGQVAPDASGARAPVREASPTNSDVGAAPAPESDTAPESPHEESDGDSQPAPSLDGDGLVAPAVEITAGASDLPPAFVGGGLGRGLAVLAATGTLPPIDDPETTTGLRAEHRAEFMRLSSWAIRMAGKCPNQNAEVAA